jgi:hypothetical protein
MNLAIPNSVEIFKVLQFANSLNMDVRFKTANNAALVPRI